MFLACSTVYASCDSSPCGVAVKIGVEDLRYRILAPSGRDQVERGFHELTALHRRCPSIESPQTAEVCSGLGDALKNAEFFSLGFREVLEKVGRCSLPPPRAKPRKQPDIDHLILQTLKEQQDSNGEAAYWIADDLLAFLLVYPEEMIETILAHPSFRQRFISNLGGDAFEDLDDTPKSAHQFLREKMRAFALVLQKLPTTYKAQPDHVKLISELRAACRCTAE
jgi:hypothetical protein